MSELAAYKGAVAAYLAGDQERLKSFLASAELSRFERELIRARVLFRERRWLEALEILEKLPERAPRFLLGERSFLLGTARFQSGDLEGAAHANLEAMAHFIALGEMRQAFNSAYNVAVDFGRLGLVRLEREYLNKARGFAASPDEQCDVFRALACLESKQKNYERCLEYLRSAEALEMHLNPVNRMALRQVAADLYVRAGQLEKGATLLEGLRKNRLNRERLRTEFEAAALRTLLKGEALPAPRALDGPKEYLWKWQVLHALQGGEAERAAEAWTQLVRAFPRHYGAGFQLLEAADAQSVFPRLLSLLVRPVAAAEQPLNDEASPTVRRLYQVLQSSAMPLRKEEIIEKLWGVRYEPTLDSRFYKAVERLRRAYVGKVVCRQRAYSLTRLPG